MLLVTEAIYSLLSRQMHGYADIQEIKKHSQEAFKVTTTQLNLTISQPISEVDEQR